jgi:uncharacterized damage-inducible protein DinB
MVDPVHALREQLARTLDWNEAHANFDTAVAAIAPEHRGALAPGFVHSAWQLIEHMRLAQRDLLDFSINPQYVHSLNWPDDYWPRDPAPSSAAAWDLAVAGCRTDRDELRKVICDPEQDLFALVPSGTGQQTLLRAVLLVIDHNAYHVGQLVALRQALGLWP